MDSENDKYLKRVLKIKDQVSEKILAKSNVIGIGVGSKIKKGIITSTICIRVYVEKKIPSKELKKKDLIPMNIQEFPTDVIEFNPSIKAIEIKEFRKSRSPILGGISIINSNLGINAGTLGCSVFDKTSGEGMILSNWHVLCGNLACNNGEPIIQPGSLDGGNDDDIVARLHRFALTEMVDCAIAKITGDRFLLPKALELGSISKSAIAELGMHVRKSGRTTGVTSGIITDIDAKIEVRGYPNGNKTFTNQIIIENENTPTSRPGDSGSVWIDNFGSAVALLFAGDNKRTIANPINEVMKALKINFVKGMPLHDSIVVQHIILN